MLEEKLSDLSREELLKKFISSEFDRFISYYQNAPDLNNKSGANRSRSKGQYARFHINVGKKQGLDAKSMIGLINDTRVLRDIEVGQIDIMNNFAFFEVPADKGNEVIPA